jgi:ATP-dependent helicase HrpA
MSSGTDLRAAVAQAAPDVSAAIGRVVAASARETPTSGADKSSSVALAWAGARQGLKTWDFDDLPVEVTGASLAAGSRNAGGGSANGEGPDGIGHGDGAAPSVRGYPALAPGPGGVELRLATTAEEATALNPLGVRELLLGELTLPSGRLTSRLTPAVALPLAASHYPSVDALTRDAQAAVVDAAIADRGLPRTREAYQALRDSLRASLEDSTHQVLKQASALVAQGRQIETEASRVAELAVLSSVNDIKNHVASLLGAGFLTRAGLGRLDALRRYLSGDEYRLPRLGTARAREERGLWLLEELKQEHEAAVAAAAPEAAKLAEVPWMLEELRVSLLAQPLGTAYPVSEKRIRRVLAGR